MKIGGFQKTSLLDYPDHISCIIWTVGCNFHCPFCYNKNIVEGNIDFFPEKEILDFLKKRQGQLEGLVITGGEPLLQKDIKSFISEVKKMKYLVKLDTNGMFPKQLENLLKNALLDYVAMDIKAPKKKYEKVTNSKVQITKIQQSIDLIRSLASDYEFRTTFVPSILDKEDIIEIGNWLQGSKRFILQQFKSNPPLLDRALEQVSPYSKEVFLEVLEAIQQNFKYCSVRGL